jgi:ADP-ribose pyrophosphatase YjhB (NUDIX family)/GNAT superfamily N-acetyltransferase
LNGPASPGAIVSASNGWRTRITRRDDPVADVLIGELNAELSGRYADEDSDPDAPLPHYREADVVCAAVVESPYGDPAGCGLLIRPSDVPEESTTGELKHVYVRPGFRGRRLAELILDALTDYARQLGLSRLILITGGPQPEAIALYRRTGWRLIPAYGGWQPFPGAIAFEHVLWDDSPPDPGGRPVRHRSTARALVIDDQHRLLLTHNRFPGNDHWALPGGGLRDEESPATAAGRELTEETGLKINNLDGPVISHDYWVPFPEVLLHQIEQIFWGRTTEHRLSRAGLEENEDYLIDLAWWPLDKLETSNARIYPRLLGDVAAALLFHGTPVRPYQITPASVRQDSA